MNLNLEELNIQSVDFLIGSMFALLVGLVFAFAQLALYRSLKTNKLVKLLHHQSTHDFLTGLPNGLFLLDSVHNLIQEAQEKQFQFAVFLLNIDRLSVVNNIFGRSKGDECLKLLAQRIRKKLPKGYTIGRMSGDEFLIVSNQLHDAEQTAQVLNQLSVLLIEPFNFYQHQLTMSCSIGVAFYPTDGRSMDQLVSRADIALKEIKRLGRNGFQYFNQDLHAYTLDYLHIENQLRRALERQEFCLYYQPIFDIQHSMLVGFEALIRWNNSERGLLSPEHFVPLAEEIGLIREIDLWMMMTASCQLKKWHDQGFLDLMVAVNVSSANFKYGLLSRNIMEVLATSKIPSECLEIELTEGVLIDDSKEVKQVLSELKTMNVSIAIDDFGTGYSCLSYLKRLDIDKLKIDKSFVMNLPQNEEDEILVKTIIDMAKRFKLHVVAEGIETQEQYDTLKILGCNLGQGYYFSKPMKADQCHIFLQEHFYKEDRMLNKE